MRLGVVSACCWLLVLGISVPSSAESRAEILDRVVQHYVGQLDERFEHGRLSYDFFDIEVVRSEVHLMLLEQTPQEEIGRWVLRYADESFYSFTEIGANHDYSTLYLLPFDESKPRPLSNGIGGSAGHSGSDFHSYDFAMPEGTPIHAARPGRVARVLDGYTEGGVGDRFKGRANVVLIVHEDGSFAEYGHLSPGIQVRPGQGVAAGDVLGRSGSTGYSSGPHLHFSIRLLETPTGSKTIPILFTDSAGSVIHPVYGRTYPQRTPDRGLKAHSPPLSGHSVAMQEDASTGPRSEGTRERRLVISSVGASPLLEKIRSSIDSLHLDRARLRVSVANEAKWEKGPTGDEVLVRWLSWRIDDGGQEVLAPRFEAVGENVTRERLARELPALFTDIEVVVDDDIRSRYPR